MIQSSIEPPNDHIGLDNTIQWSYTIHREYHPNILKKVTKGQFLKVLTSIFDFKGSICEIIYESTFF